MGNHGTPLEVTFRGGRMGKLKSVSSVGLGVKVRAWGAGVGSWWQRSPLKRVVALIMILFGIPGTFDELVQWQSIWDHSIGPIVAHIPPVNWWRVAVFALGVGLLFSDSERMQRLAFWRRAAPQFFPPLKTLDKIEVLLADAHRTARRALNVTTPKESDVSSLDDMKSEIHWGLEVKESLFTADMRRMMAEICDTFDRIWGNFTLAHHPAYRDEPATKRQAAHRRAHDEFRKFQDLRDQFIEFMHEARKAQMSETTDE